MISLLNRREVTVTHDMNRLNQLREKLDGAGIEHIVRNKRNRTFTAGLRLRVRHLRPSQRL